VSVLDGAASAELTAQQRRWVDSATAAIDDDLLRSLVIGMVNQPSPTGEEASLARWLTAQMRARGLQADYQPIDDGQGNALGRVHGDGTGADLLLYAPIDTLTDGDAAQDVPWIGPELRPDMCAQATEIGDHITGLGASNPKGHGACVIAAADAVRRAGVPLCGELLIGLGAGGMPTNRRDAPGQSRHNAGQGSGCSFMLEQGFWADYAVIAKPGWAVAWEEVGLCWFEIVVHGTFSYVGSRHRMHYRNPIVDAGIVVQAIEEWLPEYSARHTDGLVSPQGNIGWIRGGWQRTSSLSPAACRLGLDLRISPRTTPMQARAEFAEAMRRLRAAHPGLEFSWQMALAIPGTRTDPDSFIIRAAVQAWEDLTERSHEPIVANSGATDANILRSRGIPTARIGMDRIGEDAPMQLDFPAGMNCVDLREMRRLTSHLVHTIVNICTRGGAREGVIA
jgi:acetylornithine deacetylase/succinyl-diaminopimelate desuccinylase-like protein